MAASPFDHPLLSGLLGDAEITALFDVGAEIAAMVAFELALAEAGAEAGSVAPESADAIRRALNGFRPDIGKLAESTRRDGVVVPDLVRQMRKVIGEPHAEHLHKGATSQDAIDTGLAIRLRDASAILLARADAVQGALVALEARDGRIPVMAHTRMQAALPVPASRKIESWRGPLGRSHARLRAAAEEVAILHLGGPVGTRTDLGKHADRVAEIVAGRLGLRVVSGVRHSERDGIVAYAAVLALITGSLGKMGQDIALAAQSEVGEIRIEGGGRSSAMAHKQNPVGAEILVTLARFNATLVSGMHQALVHENERSGAAWTLEWMLLPQMVVATGAALRTALDLIPRVSFVATSRSS